LYRKTSGKVHNPNIFINATIQSKLTWLVDTIPKVIGICFLDDGFWADSSADLTIWTDTSLTTAFSFIYSLEGFVYKIHPPPSNIKVDIFFLELVVIFSAIYHVATNLSKPPCHLLLFTDSLDSVGILNSLLATQSMHNGVLLGIAEVILRSHLDLRVRHIEGKLNIKADLLSHLLLDDFACQFPDTCVCIFDPPHDLLPM
jgi:hypothetical protein